MDVKAKKCHHGDNVRRWREWRNINQDVLAEQVGLSQTTLSDYEKKEELRPEIIEKIAKALEIPKEAITELKDDAAINIYSGTFENKDGNGWAVGPNAYSKSTVSFHPMEKIIQLYEEKIALLERIIKEKESAMESLRQGKK